MRRRCGHDDRWVTRLLDSPLNDSRPRRYIEERRTIASVSVASVSAKSSSGDSVRRGNETCRSGDCDGALPEGPREKSRRSLPASKDGEGGAVAGGTAALAGGGVVDNSREALKVSGLRVPTPPAQAAEPIGARGGVRWAAANVSPRR